MSQLMALGPLEMVVGMGFLLTIILAAYLLYRLVYRMGKAEGALQDRDRHGNH